MAALHDLFAQFDVARKAEEWEKAVRVLAKGTPSGAPCLLPA